LCLRVLGKKIAGFAGTVLHRSPKARVKNEALAAIAIAVELGLGLLLLVGLQTRWQSGIALFTLVITFIFLITWLSRSAKWRCKNFVFFLHMAIVGGSVLRFAAFMVPGAS
jgi:putative oxidoreductase